MDIDVYLADDVSRAPLLVFNHIQKTAGTSLRVVIHANHPDHEHLKERLPRDADYHEWFGDLYARHGARLACVAGHHAGVLLQVVADRPVRGFVMLRDAVDRVLSRYHCVRGHNEERGNTLRWTLDGYFARLAAVPREVKYREKGICNGQARALLESHYDQTQLPLLAEEPDADLWRQRVFDLVERHYVVGSQARFDESVERFAKEFGWKHRTPSWVRRNRKRSSATELSRETEALVRRFNWLDEELHARALTLP